MRTDRTSSLTFTRARLTSARRAASRPEMARPGKSQQHAVPGRPSLHVGTKCLEFATRLLRRLRKDMELERLEVRDKFPTLATEGKT